MPVIGQRRITSLVGTACPHAAVMFLLLGSLLSCRASRQIDQPSQPPQPAGSVAVQQPVEPATALRKVPASQLPVLFDDGDLAALGESIERSLGWYRRQASDRVYVFGPRTATTMDMVDLLTRVRGWLAAGISGERLGAEMAQNFDAYEGGGGDEGRMLVTGYYEPVLDASLTRRAGFNVPLYRPPTDMMRLTLGDFGGELNGRRLAGRLIGNRFEPYPDRREIRETGLLHQRVLAWARDPVDAFFLEIQGSGSLRLPDGRIQRIGYASANGQAYSSIGKLLIEEDKVPREQMSMQAIRAYLSKHPEDRQRIFDYNRSTVFFRLLDGPPVGSLGVPVTPERSIATDRALFPLGALAFLDTEVPTQAADGTTISAGRLGRFVLNQDTGGAIKGAGRVDFFWGRGETQAERAGLMKQPGRLIFFLPREPDPSPLESR